MCRCRTERKKRRFLIKETEEQMERVFSAYGTPLTAVSSFRYLGRTFPSTDDNWPAVERNLQRGVGGMGTVDEDLGNGGSG